MGPDIYSIGFADPRLAAHALSPEPAWLWAVDGSRILWANPTGAVIFSGDHPGALTDLRFKAQHPAAVQIARLAGTLPPGGAPRLERLRGFGASLGGALVCQCSCITLADNSAAVLVVSTERAGKDLPLGEQARRLLAGIDQPAALFSADGELVEAAPQARQCLAHGRDLSALNAADLAREATLNGQAVGDSAAGKIALWRLGAGSTFLLLAVFGDEAPALPAAPQAPEIISVPAPPTAPPPAAAEPTTAQPATTKPVEVPQRCVPLRFVWQMDASNRFTHGVEVFARLLGPNTAAALIRPWPEIAETLKIDNGGQITRALSQHSTWSGVVIDWPTDEPGERLPIEMSGLPVFDRDRQYAGYRGFGICRDMDTLALLERHRAQGVASPPQPKPEGPSPKVVPFPTAPSPPQQRPEPPEPPAPPPAAEAPPIQEAPQATESPLAKQPAPMLSPGEHSAFKELARELSERLKHAPGAPPSHRAAASPKPPLRETPKAPEAPIIAYPPPPRPAEPPRVARNGDAARDTGEGRPILDRLPVGVLVYRLSNLLYANKAFLDWTGYESLGALVEAGGLDSLFIETKDEPASKEAQTGATNGSKPLTITTVNGNQRPVQGRLFSVAWNGDTALVLMINTQPLSDEQQVRATEASLRRLETENKEIKAILDTATDGVLVLDRAGRVLSANRSAQALFGYEAAEFGELSLGDLFAAESRRSVYDYLDRMARGSGLEAGREAIGRVRRGGLVPLDITIGRIEGSEKLCAVIRDITTWKRSEEELIAARRQAEKDSTSKSEFLAKISHEIRTPLNAIIGFSEVMIDERFGALGNERYKQYLKDIHASGSHLVALLNDLLDLSKIEAGKLELTFVSVSLNELVQECVALMQPEANRERVIIRTSLAANLPPVVADARSVRQIVFNVLSNSIKFTGAGGQVIVSTALTDTNEVVLRVRDTGSGMSDKELQNALEPFRQLATTARWGSSGTGLGLPITKALAEANHARFAISSRVDGGTLVEVAFPATRVLAQ
jgi:PAS domain S-box-containing protein